jgi:hypothetical protein
MRDIIKRILKEANDFDWMREPINPWLEYDGIIFDIEPTREDVNMYIEMALNNKKIGNVDAWETGRERDIDQIIEYQKDMGESVLAINNYGLLTFGDKEGYYGGRNLIRYNQLIEQEPLTESDDDWDWHKTPLINPWELGYTGIDFDINLTSSKNEEIKKFREDVAALIELALNRGDIRNASDWGQSLEEDVDAITNNLIASRASYLAIEYDKSLTYGTRNNYLGWGDVKFVKYSHLIGDNQLTESDDFGWIREVPLFNDSYMTYYINIYDLDSDDKCKLQQKIVDMGIHWHSGNKLQTKYCEGHEIRAYVIEGLTLYMTYTPYSEYVTFLDDPNGIIKLEGRTLLNNNLNESNEWDWIDDIPSSIELKPRTIYYAEPPLNGDEAVQLLQLITNPPKNTSHIIKRIKETETTLSYITVDSDINDRLSWNHVGGVPLAIEHGLAWGGKREYYDTVDIGVLFR